MINLDIVDGAPYLTTMPGHCIDYNKVGRPNPPYVIYKYSAHTWRRIPIDDLPKVVTKRNLMGRMLGGPMLTKGINDGFLDLSDKRQWMNSGLSDDLVKIIRDHVDHGVTTCTIMYYDGNGGWLGADWFTSAKTYTECKHVCDHNHIKDKFCPCYTMFNEKKQ